MCNILLHVKRVYPDVEGGGASTGEGGGKSHVEEGVPTGGDESPDVEE